MSQPHIFIRSSETLNNLKDIEDYEKSTEIQKICSETNKGLCLDYNMCDIIIIEGIELDYNDLKYIEKITLVVGGSIISQIDIETLVNLFDYKNNTILFHKNLFPPIQLISLKYNIVRVNIKSNKNVKYKLILNYKWYNDSIKQQLINNEYNYIYSKQYTHSLSNVNTINLSNYVYCSSGFYLITANEISNIKFIHNNNNILYNYNEDDIIKNFYLPLNNNNHSIINKLKLPDELLNIIKDFLKTPFIYWFSFIPTNNPLNIDNWTVFNLDNVSIELNNISNYKLVNVCNNVFSSRLGCGGNLYGE